MARRRKAEEKKEIEEEVFKFPEFDEREYIAKEIEKSKASIGIAFLAFLFSIISTAVFVFSLSWPLAALIGLLGFLLFKFVYPLFKVDSSILEKKDYAGHVFIYLFTWLAVFIMLVNMPFMDFTSPQIYDVHMEGMYNETWMPYNGTQASAYRMVATVTDNSGVASVEIRTNGNNTWRDMQSIGNDIYVLNLSKAPQKGTVFEIKATDNNNHESTVFWKMD